MYLDKLGNEIKLGSTIIGKYRNEKYIVIKYRGDLYADNGGNRFPLNSPNWNLNNFKVVM